MLKNSELRRTWHVARSHRRFESRGACLFGCDPRIAPRGQANLPLKPTGMALGREWRPQSSPLHGCESIPRELSCAFLHLPPCPPLCLPLVVGTSRGRPGPGGRDLPPAREAEIRRPWHVCRGQQCLPSAVGIEGGEPMQPGTPGRGRELAAAAECGERKAGEKENCG